MRLKCAYKNTYALTLYLRTGVLLTHGVHIKHTMSRIYFPEHRRLRLPGLAPSSRSF